jgi:acetylornithine/succinyldiaminopimelate/putrescine aminotransferase
MVGLLVVAGVVLAANLTDGKQLTTFSGETLTVQVADRVITIVGRPTSGSPEPTFATSIRLCM